MTVVMTMIMMMMVATMMSMITMKMMRMKMRMKTAMITMMMKMAMVMSTKFLAGTNFLQLRLSACQCTQTALVGQLDHSDDDVQIFFFINT